MHSTNAAYRSHLLAHLPSVLARADAAERLRFTLDRGLALVVLDLEPARPLLEQGYCGRKGGRSPRDPVPLLRSLVLMLMSGMTSINKWVGRLRGEPELRLLSGFTPDDKPPGVGTFYDFLARLLDGPWQRTCEHHKPPSRRLRGRHFLRNLRHEKDTQKAKTQAELAQRNQGRVEQQVQDGLAARHLPLPRDLEQRLNEILARAAVVPSAAAGLLGDLRRLAVSGDGTAIPSHADGQGDALCTCRKDGRPECTCPRRYSDPEATWGYDSHRETYYFGYRLHLLATRGDGVDLPLHLSIAGAHTPDVLLGVDSLLRLVKRLEQADLTARIAAGIFDAGYDATAYYRLHRQLHIQPIIPLAQEPKTPAGADGLPRNDEGTPLCQAGLPMRLHQRDVAGHQLVYNCPVKRPGRDNGKLVFKVRTEECPRGVLCEPDSVMGPIVHLRLDGDPRMNLPIPRQSPAFAELYKQRTCTERYNSTLKSKGDLASGAYRRQHITLTAAVLHAIALHANAWVSRAFATDKPTTAQELLAWLQAKQGKQPLAA